MKKKIFICFACWLIAYAGFYFGDQLRTSLVRASKNIIFQQVKRKKLLEIVKENKC